MTDLKGLASQGLASQGLASQGLAEVLRSCVPRGDVLRGGLTDKHFAAQLDQVIRRASGYEAYSDADSFFALTYPTEGLRDLLRGTFARLSGNASSAPNAEHAVYRYETSFGGGKTHGLIALWHLASGARPANVAEFVEPALLPDAAACRVAAFVGDSGDPVRGLTTDGVTTWTLWGEIGRQLGGEAYELVEASDASRTSCGKQTWLDMFGGHPTVIVIDEIAQYLRRLGSSGDPGVQRLASATIDSLKVLFEAATAAPAVRVIVTLATGTAAFSRETADAQTAFSDAGAEQLVAEASDVMERPKGAVGRPAYDREIGSILRRRLFESVDENAAERAAAAYRRLYAGLAERDASVGAATEDPVAYSERVRSSYPFHPALIDCLDKRIGPLPGFQRARGALKMLAEAINELWSADRSDGNEYASSPTAAGSTLDADAPGVGTLDADSTSDADALDADSIAGTDDSGTAAVGRAAVNLGDLPLEASAVRSCITSSIARERLDGPAVADFADTQASHAAGVDRQRWPRRGLAVRSCRTVFCHSVAGEPSPGAGPADVYAGTLRPGDDPDLVDEALAATSRVAWHLVSDGPSWRFQSAPNANRIIASEMANVMNADVSEELDRRIRGMFQGGSAVKTVHAPTAPADVPDEPRLHLAVFHHVDVSVESRSADIPPAEAAAVAGFANVSETSRTFRNAVVSLVADRGAVEPMRERMRFELAARRIADDPKRLQGFDKQVASKLKQLADKARLETRVAICNAYRHLYWPARDPVNSHLEHRELPARDRGEVSASQTKVVVGILKANGKVRDSVPPTDRLTSATGFGRADNAAMSTRTVAEVPWRDHSQPILLNPTLVSDAIAAGIRNGTWVYYDTVSKRASGRGTPPPAVRIAEDAMLYTRAEAERLGLLHKPVTLPAVLEVLTSAAVGTTTADAADTSTNQKGVPRAGSRDIAGALPTEGAHDTAGSRGCVSGTRLRRALGSTLSGDPPEREVLDVLARGVAAGQLAVLAAPVSADSEPLTAQRLNDARLGRLEVLTSASAAAMGIAAAEPTMPPKLVARGEGSPGAAFQQVEDFAADTGAVSVAAVEVASAVDPGEGVENLRVLGFCIPQLPKLACLVEATLTSEYEGLDGGMKVKLSGSAADYQRIEQNLLDLADRGSDMTGRLTLTLTPAQPIAHGGSEWEHLRSVITTNNPRRLSMKVTLEHADQTSGRQVSGRQASGRQVSGRPAA